jgi:predicted DNA-binding transcriptional regulator AlpA
MERKRKEGTTRQVCAYFGIKRSTLWNWVQLYGFPPPVHYSATKRDRARYPWEEVFAWEAKMRAKRFPFKLQPSEEVEGTLTTRTCPECGQPITVI